MNIGASANSIGVSVNIGSTIFLEFLSSPSLHFPDWIMSLDLFSV